MRVPQVSERIKEAPAQALRGVFAGIGQLLLITDKLRNKTPAGQQVPRARTPEPSETVSPAAPVAADPPAPAPAPAAAAAPAAASAAAPASASAAAPASAPATGPASEPAPASAAERDFDKTGNVRLLTSAEATAGDRTIKATVAEAPLVAEPGAPLPNYDELSIPSLRARLRNLDVAQLRQLVEYERAHADRADVITMFERRIAKLQAETTPEERGEAAAEAEAEAQDAVDVEVEDEVGPEAEGET
jgi:hypothetical protein